MNATIDALFTCCCILAMAYCANGFADFSQWSKLSDDSSTESGQVSLTGGEDDNSQRSAEGGPTVLTEFY